MLAGAFFVTVCKTDRSEGGVAGVALLCARFARKLDFTPEIKIVGDITHLSGGKGIVIVDEARK